MARRGAGGPGRVRVPHAVGRMWHAFYNGWVEGPVAAVAELVPALVDLRTGRPQHLSDALLITAEMYNRADDWTASGVTLAQALAVLEETGDDWGIAAHDNLVARNRAAVGELDAAEEAARASVECLQRIGEEWLIFEGLGLLAIIIETRDDLARAAETYEALIARAHAAGVPNYETLWGLVSPGSERASATMSKRYGSTTTWLRRRCSQ